MSEQRKDSARGRGRPLAPRDVRIIPVRRSAPDARKIGRALLALALHQAAVPDDGPTEEADDESA